MASGGSGSVSIEREEETHKRLEDRLSVLEASKAALDQAAKSGGQRAFIPGLGAAGKVLSQPPRPGSVYFCVQNTSALRSDVARQGNLNSNGNHSPLLYVVEQQKSHKSLGEMEEWPDLGCHEKEHFNTRSLF